MTEGREEVSEERRVGMNNGWEGRKKSRRGKIMEVLESKGETELELREGVGVGGGGGGG